MAVDSSYELVARKEADRGRNQALGALAFVAVILSIVAWLGVERTVKKALEDVGIDQYAKAAAAAAAEAQQRATKAHQILTELQERFDQSDGPIVWTGTIVPFAGPTDMELAEGWLPCDGRALKKNDYVKLFEAIKYTWGGEGDEFLLPDLQGRFLRGVDNGVGRDWDRDRRTHPITGEKVGDKVGSLQDDATRRPRNAFVLDDPGNHHHGAGTYNRFLEFTRKCTTLGSDKIVVDEEPSLCNSKEAIARGGHSHEIVGGGDNETRPVNASVQWIIKVR